MKSKKILSAILTAVIVISALVMTSCSVSDKSITDTKYSLVMIGDLPVVAGSSADVDTNTLNGSVWGAVKEISETDAKLIKYYKPVFSEPDESVSYADTITNGYKTQLTLASAAMNEKGIIVLPGAQTIPAYNAAKGEKASENIKFVIVGTPSLSDTAKTEYINSQTVSVVFNDIELGYLCGYTAVKSGNTSLGYLGLEDDRSKGVCEGFLIGAQAAATEMGIAAGTITFTYSYYTVSSKDSNTSADAARELFKSAQLVLAGDTVAEDALISNTSGNFVISTGGATNDAVKFSYGPDYKKVLAVTKEAINIAQNAERSLVKVYGCNEGLYTFSCAEGFSFTAEDASGLINTVGDFAEGDNPLEADGELTNEEYPAVTIAKK